jgi:hypothetical protein
MSSVVISGDTSGAITLAAPAIAGTNTITLPAQTATIATLTTPSFATTIGVGGATAAASGAGITFPASQSASSDANTLDDYEEGTFTATLTSATPPSTPPTTTAHYTKTGRMVTVAMRFGNVNTSGGSGAMFITGLPFTPTGTPADCYTAISSMHSFSFSGSWVAAYTSSVSAIYFLQTTSGSAWSDMTITAGTGRFLQFSLTYQVA